MRCIGFFKYLKKDDSIILVNIANISKEEEKIQNNWLVCYSLAKYSELKKIFG